MISAEVMVLSLFLLLFYSVSSFVVFSFLQEITIEKNVIEASTEAENRANLEILGNCSYLTHFPEIRKECSGYCVPRVVVHMMRPALTYYGKDK